MQIQKTIIILGIKDLEQSMYAIIVGRIQVFVINGIAHVLGQDITCNYCLNFDGFLIPYWSQEIIKQANLMPDVLIAIRKAKEYGAIKVTLEVEQGDSYFSTVDGLLVEDVDSYVGKICSGVFINRI